MDPWPFKSATIVVVVIIANLLRAICYFTLASFNFSHLGTM